MEKSHLWTDLIMSWDKDKMCATRANNPEGKLFGIERGYSNSKHVVIMTNKKVNCQGTAARRP
jgi:hypothetical protein